MALDLRPQAGGPDGRGTAAHEADGRGTARGAPSPLALVPRGGDLGAEAAALVDRVRDLGDRLADPGVTADDRRSALSIVDRAVSLLGLVQARLLGAVKADAAAGDPERERQFVAGRGLSSRQGRGRALAEDELGRALTLMPEVSAAVQDGTMTLDHAQAVADVMGRTGERARGVMVEHAEEIVEAARDLDVPELRRVLRRRAAELEADAADRSFAGARHRRHLRLVTRADGVEISGFLDPIAGETVRTALEAVTPVPAADDDRSGQQRSADALVALCGRALGVGVDRAGAQLRPHLNVLLREDTWALLARRRALGHGAGAAAGSEDDDLPRQGLTGAAFEQGALLAPPPLAQLIDGTLVPFGALEVLACDATLQRTVLDPAGEPLDVGRTARTFTGSLRRAALVRDRHCQWPGCRMRAWWCEIHHLRYWSHGGGTDLTNAITLCSAHHHRVHEQRVTILAVRGGFAFAESGGRTIGTTTRLHDDLLVPRAGPPRASGPRERPAGARPPDPQLAPVTPVAPVTHAATSRRVPLGVRHAGRQPPDDDDLPPDCPALLW
ncbi:putative HNH endonuclease domain protein [Serinibacter arcticus]|uniref:Putative HNH endonuclease domain protein n=1 Tax=Serinibacter arcticus TaxID=1655435 RepID=A0A4Z1E3G4_9MICO|nr:putative HNH endonuclease domain protein [Serinibacter arcticus]